LRERRSERPTTRAGRLKPPLVGLAAAALLAATTSTLFAGPADEVAIDPKILPVVEKKLDNGLRILLLEDHSVPSITYWTFFRVGSRNEKDGTTGLSHLFEHMMFNGAKKYGPKAFDQSLERAGGSSNAYTTQDVTAYFEDFPPEALELVVDLESDRMRSLTITEKTLEPERGVVKEERRLRTDDDPMGALEEVFYAKAFDKHPYHWPVVGWMKDLNAIKVKDAVSYFKTYYGPNNATVIVVGDFNADAAFELIKKYYSDIPKQPEPPKVKAVEPAQKAPKRVSLEREAQLGAVMLGYTAPAAMSGGAINPDVPRLDILQKILAGGESSRLYRTLVYEKELCADVSISFPWTIDPGVFVVTARLTPGASADVVEKEIEAIIKDLADKGPTEAEVKKAKTQLLVELLDQLATNNGRGNLVGTYEVLFGSYKAILDAPKMYQAETPETLKAAAAKYLIPNGKTTAVLIPKKGGGR
jgi:predicted Zn-dependent peptidase